MSVLPSPVEVMARAIRLRALLNQYAIAAESFGTRYRFTHQVLDHRGRRSTFCRVSLGLFSVIRPLIFRNDPEPPSVSLRKTGLLRRLPYRYNPQIGVASSSSAKSAQTSGVQ